MWKKMKNRGSFLERVDLCTLKSFEHMERMEEGTLTKRTYRGEMDGISGWGRLQMI